MCVHIKSAWSDAFGIFIVGNYGVAIVNKPKWTTHSVVARPFDGWLSESGLLG